MTRTLVIGATGNVGRDVVSQLLSTGAQVRAMARNPGAAGLPTKVEVIYGDLSVPESVDASLAGIDTVFLVWFAPPGFVAPVLERIANQARRIVFLSSPYKHPDPFFQASQPNASVALHVNIERLIEA